MGRATARRLVREVDLVESDLTGTLAALNAYKGQFGDDWAAFAQAEGEVGEICIRGPQVMKGYWQRPDETELVFYPDRFLRTGDMGYIDKDGFVFLVDRKKDMILVSGFNVYPNEVEEVLVLGQAGIIHPAALRMVLQELGDLQRVLANPVHAQGFFIPRRHHDQSENETRLA